MWISRKLYQDQYERGLRAEAIVSSLKSHNIALQTTMDWLRVRLTQLEFERAQLIHNYMGVKLAVPSIEPAPQTTNTGDLFNQLPSFEDVGDEEAARLGLTWDSQGELVTGKR